MSMSLPLMFLQLVLTWLPGVAALAVSQALPGCENQCGNISIPYPFGMREGCYIDGQFLVTCDDSNDPPKLFLMNSTIEVTDIFLFGELRLSYWIGYDCYTAQGTRDKNFNTWMNSNRFPISNTRNKFTAVGCDTYAVIGGVRGRKYTTGCLSLCDSIENVINGSCSGIGCCQTSIPKEVRGFQIEIFSYDNHTSVWSFNPCSYAFVAEETAFNFSSLDLADLQTRAKLPVILDWAVGYEPCDEARKNQTSYACKENSECYNFDNGPGYRCNCSEGYEGNPYLSNGCQDIDECRISSPCNMTCHNLPGTYNCSCPKGYEGDGRKNGLGCSRILSKRLPLVNIALVLLPVGFSLFDSKLQHNQLGLAQLSRILVPQERGQGLVSCHGQASASAYWCYFLVGLGYIGDLGKGRSSNSERSSLTKTVALCCSEGYEGNPYLSNGCQDIDECRISSPCNMTCHNLPGTYNCSCPKGYEGDGRKNGLGCSRILSKRLPLVNIALGISISILVLLLGGSWLYWGFRQRKIIKLREKFFEQNGGVMLQQKLSKRDGSFQSSKRHGLVKSFEIFTEEYLKKATNNYHESRILGQGGQGTVYKGILPDDTIVAIKKSKIGDKSQVVQFINEITILSQINYTHVVKLLGCCLETQVPLLVYEFVANGTLYDHLHTRSCSSSSITWENRLRIATETAGVLSYLHSAADPPIIHRDIKSSNILLDENYTAKVSDFGASKLFPTDQTQLTTLVQGTLGYLDPEYFHTSQLTEKSDVYSFGVLLVELLTGKKALCYDRPEKERNLATYFISSMKEDRLFEIVDEHVINEGKAEQLKEFAMVAKGCLEVKGDERPTMNEVAMELQGLRMVEKHQWVKDDNNSEEAQSLLCELSYAYGDGTLGYLDPEYFHTSQLTEKSDVYSFGVLLVELLTGKKALCYDRPEKERNLATYFISSMKEDRLFEIVDEHVINEGKAEQLKEFAMVAKGCLEVKGDERPTMNEVAMELQGLRMVEKHQWVKDDNNSEEAQSLLCELSYAYGDGTSISAAYDSMTNHVISPFDGGR
ncbi:Wall-associated receptor kinase [Actinidia chinensis var. chinensis]|uniref:Wall-associated receptor kinase n=1 Tax=Actinidia chinensis var. chinensis TaxID=1590841 RepID=A0A2R6Q135_ACTCC|nr:Wall-associated receptor kinase [Actinidia chinensis var. chinensis]